MYMHEGLMTDKLSLLFGNGYNIGSGYYIAIVFLFWDSLVCAGLFVKQSALKTFSFNSPTESSRSPRLSRKKN